MKTSNVSSADLARSVWAVPPLARFPDYQLNAASNVQLIKHIEAGGISTILYGGNANLYHVPLNEYGGLLELWATAAAPDTWVIPSAGPDYGRLLDQAELLRGTAFPAVMVLPAQQATTPDGLMTGLRRFAERLAKPLILYIKTESGLSPRQAGALWNDGLLCAIKYAIVRADPSQDTYLSELLQQVDRANVISGIGERPIVNHVVNMGLAGYTSGGVCLAPRAGRALLSALKHADRAEAARLQAPFLALEQLRDDIHPFQVLQAAVTLSGVADMGPLLPLLSDLPREHYPVVAEAAQALVALDRTLEEAEGHAS